MSDDTNYSCRSNHADIISAIDYLLCKSPLLWKWRWVEGHQDNFYGPLDRWATLNVEVDSAAKKRSSDDATLCPPIQYTIHKEMWHIYTGVPDACMADEIPPHYHK
eukprot:12783897-Ditylum_brightwellii.AAC.1